MTYPPLNTDSQSVPNQTDALHSSADLRVLEADRSDWQAWSTAVGTAALPVLQSAAQKVPSTTAIMLCSADGLNLCALGVGADQVGHVAALSSTLFSVSNAQVQALDPASQEEPRAVSIDSGDIVTAVVGVSTDMAGQMRLLMSARDVLQGVVIATARQASQQLVDTFRTTDPLRSRSV